MFTYPSSSQTGEQFQNYEPTLIILLQIYISMAGDDGEWCKEHGLHKFWRNNFEKRHTDIFKVKRPDLGDVKEICVRRGGMCPLDKW